mmetsp:Transcript_33598/g.72396  ORF Transcript_33598/g.72396 Transcript_33598/m.72396 type:complete len:82 (-) Transcript_33598:1382-1627(-)
MWAVPLQQSQRETMVNMVNMVNMGLSTLSTVSTLLVHMAIRMVPATGVSLVATTAATKNASSKSANMMWMKIAARSQISSH